jgi:hypothetical protein
MFAPVLSNSHQKFLVPLETKENQKAHLGMRNDGQEYRYRIGCGVSAAGGEGTWCFSFEAGAIVDAEGRERRTRSEYSRS